MVKSLQPETAGITEPTTAATRKIPLPKWLRSEKTLLLVLLALAILTWLPRLKGPIDLRWDAGVYYILGTSLAEGKGYRLLNEPGEIEAVQYPPLLPLIVAGHQLILGTNDPTTVGSWLRFTAFIIFLVYIYAAFTFFKNYLSLHYAFLATVLCLFSLHVFYLSDLLFPEILFSLATLLFILSSKI
jgi:4-amino-4-deoxy-L-arabinose transferase-like glycosyltransferase